MISERISEWMSEWISEREQSRGAAEERVDETAEERQEQGLGCDWKAELAEGRDVGERVGPGRYGRKHSVRAMSTKMRGENERQK